MMSPWARARVPLSSERQLKLIYRPHAQLRAEQTVGGNNVLCGRILVPGVAAAADAVAPAAARPGRLRHANAEVGRENPEVGA